LFVAFENPLDSNAPIVTNLVLMPRQELVSATSPLLSGLRPGQYYEVAVFAHDRDADEVVFEHRQLLRYLPAPGYPDEILPAMAGPPMQFSLPIGAPWEPSNFERTSDSLIPESSVTRLSRGNPVPSIGLQIERTVLPISECAE
jgi:hypothetical protein